MYDLYLVLRPLNCCTAKYSAICPYVTLLKELQEKLTIRTIIIITTIIVTIIITTIIFFFSSSSSRSIIDSSSSIGGGGVGGGSSSSSSDNGSSSSSSDNGSSSGCFILHLHAARLKPVVTAVLKRVCHSNPRLQYLC